MSVYRAGKWAAVIAVAVLVFAQALPAVGNDTAVNGIGGALAPMESTDIRMTAETIQAHVYNSYAEFQVDFEFDNGGAAQTLRLGFPFRLRSTFEMEEGSPGGAPVAGFMAWQDDSPLDVTYEEGTDSTGEPMGYFVHEVTFAPGTTMVRVRYLADASGDSGWAPPEVVRPDWAAGIQNGMHVWYPYWVHTGAGWASTIGSTVARFTVSDDFLGWGIDDALSNDGARPYSKPDARSFEWVLRDFEPTVEDNIRFSFYETFGDGEPGTWPVELQRRFTAQTAGSSALVLGEYGYPPMNAFNGVSTAWAEAANGSGTGQWAQVTYGAPRDIQEVRILPGYAKRPDLFYKYNRPKTLTLSFSDGTQTTVTLADEPSLQRFAVKATTEWVKVTIGEVYPGTTRDETYLSLVDVGAASAEYASFDSLLAQAGVAPTAETTVAEESTVAPAPDAPAEPDESLSAAAIAAIAAGVAFIAVVAWLLLRRAKSVSVS